MTAAHPAIAISPLADLRAGIAQDLDLCDDLGDLSYGLSRLKLGPDLELSAELVKRLVGRVAYVHHSRLFTLDDEDRWAAQRTALIQSLELAHRTQATVVIATTGPAGALLTWEQAADAFTRAVAPVLPTARSLGVRICVEQTNVLRHDISFVTTLADLVTLAAHSGVAICADMFWSWRERDLAESIRLSIPDLGLIQVADYQLGTMSMPDRVVLGDGVIPFEWLVTQFAAAGYQGLWDLELLGPRIAHEGSASALRRGAQRMSEVLERHYPHWSRQPAS
jgi:sugar phosphate isomerase/epimerase